MEKKDKLLNYTLSIGFILLIVIFLTTIISISRFVLSDGNPIQEHVASTKNLLEDIEKVEKTVEKSNENIEIKNSMLSNSALSISRNEKISNFDNNIIDMSYLEINNNKSFMTFTINSKISKLDNIYYLEYDNETQLQKGEIILYNVKEKGVILVSDNKNEINVFNFESSNSDIIEFGNILGKIVYIEKND